MEGEEDTLSNKKENICFLFYPVVFLFLIHLLTEKKIDIARLVFGSLLPYYFTFFMLQFVFPGPLYLPFQVGMLFAMPLVTYLVSYQFDRTIYMIYFFFIVYLMLLGFINNSILSFFYIWASITVYFLLVCFSRHLVGEWEKEYGERIGAIYQKLVVELRQFWMKKIFVSKDQGT